MKSKVVKLYELQEGDTFMEISTSKLFQLVQMEGAMAQVYDKQEQKMRAWPASSKVKKFAA